MRFLLDNGVHAFRDLTRPAVNRQPEKRFNSIRSIRYGMEGQGGGKELSCKPNLKPEKASRKKPGLRNSNNLQKSLI